MRRPMVLFTTMALTLLVASGVALAAGIGSAGAQSSVVRPGESIQKAINAADPGDTIIVRGVHHEDLAIRKDGIKLRGDDAVIEPPAKADSPCSKTFGPEAICILGHPNFQPSEITGPRVKDVSVPLSYAEELYALRTHIQMVGNRLRPQPAPAIAAEAHF